MLAVLVGIINRTNWKKPNTQRGSFSITVQESEHPQHTKRGHKGKTFAPFLFCVSSVREKETKATPTTHPQRATRTQREQRTTGAERDKEKDKSGAKG